MIYFISLCGCPPPFYYVSPANLIPSCDVYSATDLFCLVCKEFIPGKHSTHYTGQLKYCYRPIIARANKGGIHPAIKPLQILIRR